MFQEAADLPADRRGQFLDERCGSDDDLRREIEALLSHEGEAAASFLAGRHEEAAGAHPSEAPGTAIGPYRILGLVGEGAFGDVYLAEQTRPVRRQVALKIVKLGMDTRQVVARFEAERQALALMDHPNIATVYDAGATDAGRPYFAMEHVPGVSLTRFCDQRRLDTEERLGLFLQVCDAIQHAHQKGIIHRDIKPSNILVEFVGDQPVPKVIDFGIAKAMGFSLTERTLLTERGQLIGTPEYMSPEQAEMSGLNIDTRTDIYSLGVVLYELLVGTLPFDPETFRQGTIQEIQRRIREEQPPTPSTRLSTLGDDSAGAASCRRTDLPTLRRRLKGDLDWITMKAMAKEPQRRYSSASELAADIRRHLDHEPVLAGPPSTVYRIGKFVRRNRAVVGGAAVAAAALLLGTAVAVWQAVHATEETSKAVAIKEFLGGMLGATDLVEAGRKLDVQDILGQAVGDVEAQFAGQPEVEAEVRLLIGRSYASRGDFRESLEQLEAARDIRHRLLGPQHPDTLETAHSLADVLATLRRFEEAEELLRDVVEGRRRALGEDHPDTLWSMSLLSYVLTQRYALEEAETVGRRACAGLANALGEDHERTLHAQLRVAGYLSREGKKAEALKTHRRSVVLARRALGEEHRLTLKAKRELGACLAEESRWGQDKWEEAEQLLRSTLEAQRRIFGDADYRTHYWTWTFGDYLRRFGRTEAEIREGEQLVRTGVDGVRRVFGDRHLWTAYGMMRLAGLELAKRNFERAVELKRQCLEITLESLGEDHPEPYIQMSELGFLMHQLGKSEEGEALVRRALEKQRQILGNEHGEVANRLVALCLILRDRGRFDEAEPLAREMLAIRAGFYGDDDPLTLWAKYSLAKILYARGKLEEAEQHYRELADARRRVLGPAHRDTLSATNDLAVLLYRQQRNEEAVSEFEALITAARSALGDEQWFTAVSCGDYAHALIELGRFADTESMLLEMYAGRQALDGNEHEATREAVRMLADLYDAWDRPEKAAEYRELLTEPQPVTARD